MNISDVYASASRSEGFSISVLEALSCGLGLFLSDIPSHREVVMAGKDIPVGVLFKQTDIEGALSRIRKMSLCKSTISRFQRDNLSARRMTALYDYEYSCEDL